MLSDVILAADNIASENIFLGGPQNAFTRIGRNQLIALLDAGLTPDCKVLDVGCGCLRGGWWLIHFLNPGNYFGIEPNTIMLETGLKHLFKDQSISVKCPSFAHNDNFDFAIFGVKFDFLVARSVWSHAAPKQIEAMLDSFLVTTSEEGCFLTSFRETNDPAKQYTGNSWFGRSHQSDIGGMIEYTYEWLCTLCIERNLAVKKMHMDFGQQWIKIYKKSSKNQQIVLKEPKNGRIL